MRRFGLVLLVVTLAVAAWFFGRQTVRPREVPASAQSEERPQEPPPFQLRLVSTRDGLPIAGARVLGDDGADLGTTDGDGRLVVPDDSTRKISVTGYVPEHGLFVEGRTAWVELTPGAEVSGVVLDAATKGPVAKAFVETHDLDAEWLDFVWSDEAGRFSVKAPLGQPFLLCVSMQGVARVVERRVIDGPLRDLEVIVGQGGILEGAVTLADGSPPDRSVALYLVLARKPAVPRPEDEVAQTYFDSDAGGHFRLCGVPLGVDFCVNEFKGEKAWSEPVRFAREGEVQRTSLRIPSRATLNVKVVGPEVSGGEEDEEAPESGDGSDLILVEVDLDEERPGATTFDQRSWGRDCTFGVPPGACRIRVAPPDEMGWASQERRIVIAEGETREEVFRLSGGETIEGVLLDVDGTPDDDTPVRCMGRGFEAEAKTDREGRFALRGLPRGLVTLVAESYRSAGGRAMWTGVVPVVEAVVLRLPRAALLTGRIAGAGLAAPIRVEVSTEHGSDRPDSFLLEGGRFSVEVGAVAEPVVVSLSLPDFGAPAVFAFPALRPGEVRDLGEIRLDHGRAVRGVVLGADGSPVVGATVAVLEAWSDAFAWTDTKGGFTLIRMPWKPLWVRIRAAGIPPHVVRIEDGATVRLGPGGTVTGAGPARIRSEGDEWLEWRYAETEIDTFPATLQAGNYRAKWDDGRTAEFVVRDGETTKITPR